MTIEHHTSSAEAPANVVVIGASGFVGPRLMALLGEEGVPVAGVGSSDIDLTSSTAPGELQQIYDETSSIVFLSAITPDKGRGIDTFQKNIQML